MSKASDLRDQKAQDKADEKAAYEEDMRQVDRNAEKAAIAKDDAKTMRADEATERATLEANVVADEVAEGYVYATKDRAADRRAEARQVIRDAKLATIEESGVRSMKADEAVERATLDESVTAEEKALLTAYVIAGHVTKDKISLDGIDVVIVPADYSTGTKVPVCVTVGECGFLSAQLGPGDYFVTPRSERHTFYPESRIVTVFDRDVRNVEFVVGPPR